MNYPGRPLRRGTGAGLLTDPQAKTVSGNGNAWKERFVNCSVGLADFKYVVDPGSQIKNQSALVTASPIDLAGVHVAPAE